MIRQIYKQALLLLIFIVAFSLRAGDYLLADSFDIPSRFEHVINYRGQCVLEKPTGLMWEVKQTDGLHRADDTYSWYSSVNHEGDTGLLAENEATCFGYSANHSNTFCNTQAYVERVNAASWCGFNDWRLPVFSELMGLLDLGMVNKPYIDRRFFPNTVSNQAYWTASSLAGASNHQAWAVTFGIGPNTGIGQGVSQFKSTGNAIRLVRNSAE